MFYTLSRVLFFFFPETEIFRHCSTCVLHSKSCSLLLFSETEIFRHCLTCVLHSKSCSLLLLFSETEIFRRCLTCVLHSKSCSLLLLFSETEIFRRCLTCVLHSKSCSLLLLFSETEIFRRCLTCVLHSKSCSLLLLFSETERSICRRERPGEHYSCCAVETEEKFAQVAEKRLKKNVRTQNHALKKHITNILARYQGKDFCLLLVSDGVSGPSRVHRKMDV